MADGIDTPEERALYDRAIEELLKHGVANAPATVGQYKMQVSVPDGAVFDNLVLSRRVKTRSLHRRVTSAGIGVPVVAEWESTQERRREHPLLSEVGYAYPLTANLRFPATHRVELVLSDPRETEQIKLGGRSYPLAADYSAPYEVELSKRESRMSKIGALIHSANYLDKLGLIALEPPKRDKMPVVFVHGLMSRPDTWAQMTNALTSDPEVRRHFQFYYFRYPTGVPVLYSAAKLRDQLAILQAELRRIGNPYACDIALVGHSMGGLISKAQVQESGDLLWISQFGAPPEQLHLRAEVRAALAPYFEYHPNRCIERVIFISTPHRGSKMADFRIVGVLSRTLIKLPFTVLDRTFDFLLLQKPDDPVIGKLLARRVPSSVDNLSPESPFVKNSTRLPVAPEVHLHSIVGNKKGLPLTDPRAGDGVVPYASAHLDAAESEVVVRSGHGAHDTPEAAAEIRRILLLHLRQLN